MLQATSDATGAPPILLRPTYASISLEHLRRNLRLIRSRLEDGVLLAAVVKADAYGHALTAVARTLEEEGAAFFCVATIEEGIELRRIGCTHPILLLSGFSRGGGETLVRERLTPAIFCPSQAEELTAAAQAAGHPVQIHLKVDTGMGRLGVPAERAHEWLTRHCPPGWLEVEGIFSNLATSDIRECQHARDQIRRFEEAVRACQAAGYNPRIRHLSNSSATFHYPQAHYDMVRPGCALYGFMPTREAHDDQLAPVLSLHTRILFLKNVPPGTALGYGRSFITARDSVIATLPIGYEDGYPRSLSNRATVIVRGCRARVVGKISMDLTLVDVTDVTGVQEGDDVVLLGESDGDCVSIYDLAETCGTIAHEFFCGLSPRVPRIAQGHGHASASAR